jgi:hypothetical protein
MSRVSADLADLRDRLTCGWLTAAAEGPRPVDAATFRRSWWDGAVRVPTLIVRFVGATGRSSYRLVETGGQVIALPASGWRARRALRRLRRPATVDPRLLALARDLDPTSEQPARVAVVRQRGDLPRGRPTLPSTHRTMPAPLVELEQDCDAVRCSHADCAALIPIPPPGQPLTDDIVCVGCGRPAFELTQPAAVRTAQRVR